MPSNCHLCGHPSAPEKQQRSEAIDAGAMPTKHPRTSSKPTSAAHNNLDASSLHLLPRFVGIISRIEDEKLQAEARVALQDHDSQMDAAMELVDDGKRLVSEGESKIKDAYRNVCAALTRLFGGAYDLGSPRDIRARCRFAAKSGATPEDDANASIASGTIGEGVAISLIMVPGVALPPPMMV